MAKNLKGSLSVRVEGMSALEGIPGGIDRAQQIFLNRTGKRLRDSLTAATPRRSGRLARSWRYVVEPTQRVRLINDQPYAKSTDRGAFIQPKRGKYLRFRVEGREVFVKSVRLPAQQFSRKGLRGRGRIVGEEFAKAMDQIRTTA